MIESGEEGSQKMSQPQDNSESETSESRDRTQELTWALIDESINGQEFAELEDRLLNEESARKTYFECIQLHAELAEHFSVKGGDATSARPTKTPILGFLGSDSGPLTGLNAPKS